MSEQSAAVEIPEHPSGVLYRILGFFRVTERNSQAAGFSALLFVCLTWLPLFLMTLASGTALPGKVHIPFLLDYSSLCRYLIAGPVILTSEPIVRPWMKRIINQFIVCHIIPPHAHDKFKALLEQVLRLQISLIPQLILLVIAFGSSFISADIAFHAHVTTWQTEMTAHGTIFTLAGNFQNFFSQPVFRFVWLEAMFQYGLWMYFLIRMSSFPLTVHPTHADGAGGLGFIAAGQTSFTLLAFAMSCGVAGAVERLLRIHPAKINEHWDMLALWVIFMLAMFLGPLLAFTPMLVRSKRDALFAYGKLSHNASYGFGKHWIGSHFQEVDNIDDVDTSCELDHSNNAYQAVSNMRPFIFDRQVVISFAIACVLPAIPLVLAQIPWSQICEQLKEVKEYL